MSNQYIKDAIRTLSPNFHDNITVATFASRLGQAIAAGRLLNEVKALTFYGENPQKELFAEPNVNLGGPGAEFNQGIKAFVTTQNDEVLIHGVLGVFTESAELVELLRNYLFSEGEDRNHLDITNLREELGDVFWYLAILAHQFGFSFEEIQNTNIAKLKARFPQKFETEQANVRDLQTERVILEREVVERKDKPRAKLENWYVLGNMAYGIVFGHPRLEDLTEVHTSKILNQTETEIETLNTVYVLGKPYTELN